ncbi:MAG: thiosulfate oxidation carrier complex protein SoxZ, partial [Gammaproteobacteria bacterium]|nr:thiosulfate oxidation carrier complex protein SoxZ [Gammaproteobacteria bacterium]
MATKTIRLRASNQDGVATVKALITHPMETGLRKDKKTGKAVPAHFIQTVSGKHNGQEVIMAEWSGAISKNPYLSFQFSGAKTGDTVELSWSDNNGDSETT